MKCVSDISFIVYFKVSNYLLFIIFVVLINTYQIAFASQSQKINFWNVQQKGANIFNRNITIDDIKVAKQYGIKFIRLAPDKFISSNADF